MLIVDVGVHAHIFLKGNHVVGHGVVSFSGVLVAILQSASTIYMCNAMSPIPLCSSGDFIKFVHDQMEQSALSVTTFLPDSKVALVRHTEPKRAGK